MSTLLKQYASLVKNVSSITDAQVEVMHDDFVGDEDSLAVVPLVVSPKGGLYRGGKFVFSLSLNNNGEPPEVICQTPIYHPNIDTEGEVCLNLLDDLWTSSNTLEDIVQGILFLFYNPNLTDPLNELISGSETYEDFKENVRKSLRGETIDYYSFERNLPEGFVEEDHDAKFEVGERVECVEELDCSDFIQKMFEEVEEETGISEIIQPEEEEHKNGDLMCPDPESCFETNCETKTKPIVGGGPDLNLQSESTLSLDQLTTDDSHEARFSRSLSVHTTSITARLFKLVTGFLIRLRSLYPFRLLFWNSSTHRTLTVVK